MSTKFSGESLKKKLQGKKLGDSVKGKIKDSFSDKDIGSGEVKKELIKKIAGKSAIGRKKIYKEFGLNPKERSKLENHINPAKKENNELTERQKRRNIFESKRSAEEAEKTGGQYASGPRRKSSTVGYGGGEVKSSYMTGGNDSSQSRGIAGGSYTQRQSSRGVASRRGSTGFAKKQGGTSGVKPPSRGGGAPRKPLGF